MKEPGVGPTYWTDLIPVRSFDSKDSFIRVPLYSWRGVFEHTKRLNGFLIRISLVVAGRPSVETGLASVSLAKSIMKLARKSGLLYTALYLKQCGVALQRYYGGNPIINESVPLSVSLNRAGLPRIIPPYLRRVISKRDERSDRLVRLFLSWFTVCRIIELAKKIFRDTFDSITQPTSSEQLEYIHELIKENRKIFRMYVPRAHAIPMDIGMAWIPTWKALPSKSDSIFCHSAKDSSIFNLLKYEMYSFAVDLNFVNSLEGVFSPCILWIKSTLWPFSYSWNTMVANTNLSTFESSKLPEVFSSIIEGMREVGFTPPGRIAQVLDGAGKRRLFAIGNSIKQRLLRPVHDWAMSVLRTLPTDGTFDQMGPIRRLQKLPDIN